LSLISWNDFEKIDIRTGTILEASFFKEAKVPAIKLTIDFGELGVKKSSAQITHFYLPEKLIGMQIVAVVNFPPKQIANFMSECLVLGVVNAKKEVTLLTPSQNCENGTRIG